MNSSSYQAPDTEPAAIVAIDGLANDTVCEFTGGGSYTAKDSIWTQTVIEWPRPTDWSDGEPEASQPGHEGAFRSVRKARWRSKALPYHLIRGRVGHPESIRRRFPLSADHTLLQTYYHVYRAIWTNVGILGLDFDLMGFDDYPSPFLPLSSSATSSIRRLPDQLVPTALQKTVDHHPEVDVFPDPVFRDNFINGTDHEMDDDDFCFDLIGSQNSLRASSDTGPACYVWGEPWDVRSWEMAEWFVRKYFWLFVGAVQFETSTNIRRQERDLPPLSFAAITSEAIAIATVS